MMDVKSSLKVLRDLLSNPKVQTRYAARKAFRYHFEKRRLELVDVDWCDVAVMDSQGTLHAFKIWFPAKPRENQEVPLHYLQNFVTAALESSSSSPGCRLYLFSTTPLTREAYAFYKKNQAFLTLVLSKEAKDRLFETLYYEVRRHSPLRPAVRTLDDFLAAGSTG
ncbi:MAG: hypothetical protein Kow0069_06770 [Promethearchaeota archaeon]